MGKRKILIEEIKDDRQKRSVTFTKRRDGLFKKAETACQKFGGLQIGIVAFSPAGKPFTFSNSTSVSVDEIIDRYMSSSTSTSCSTSSSAVVMGKRRNRSEEDDVQVIETEKKQKTLMNDAAVVTTTPPPCSITIVQEEEEEEEEDEKLDQGFHWDHYKNLDDSSDQTHHHDDQELRNEFSMGYYGENNAGINIVTEEMINMVESSQCLVEVGDNTHNWAPPDVQEIINVEDDDDDFEYADHHCDDDETTMGLVPPSHTSTTTTTTSSFCDLLSASDTYDDEEDYGYTLEEWEHILSTSSCPTVVVDTSSYLNQEVEVPADDNWPTQEFVQHLCS